MDANTRVYLKYYFGFEVRHFSLNGIQLRVHWTWRDEISSIPPSRISDSDPVPGHRETINSFDHRTDVRARIEVATIPTREKVFGLLDVLPEPHHEREGLPRSGVIVLGQLHTDPVDR